MRITDQKKLDMELAKLKEEIKYGRNDPMFYVSSLPAGTFKTTTFIDAVVELSNEGSSRKSIFVQFNKDIGSQDIALRINQKSGKFIAKAIDSSMNPQDLLDKNLANYPVLVLTHEMYLTLIQNKQRRELYLKGRENLIIDEEVNWIKKHSINREDIERFTKDLPIGLMNKYIDLALPLERLIDATENVNYNSIRVIRNVPHISADYVSRVDDFRRDLEVAIDSEYLKRNNAFIKQARNKSYYFQMCKMLKLLALNGAVIDRNGVTVFDRDRYPLLLANNIILDANANFSMTYQLSRHFRLNRVKDIVSYDDWNFHICKKNSSKSSKAGYVDYYDELVRHIEANVMENDKVLIVGSLSDKSKLTAVLRGGKVEFMHFQKLAGRNDWYDFNKIYIIDTPYFGQRDYVVDKLFYESFLNERFLQDDEEHFIRQMKSYQKGMKEAYLAGTYESSEEYLDDVGAVTEMSYRGMLYSMKMRANVDKDGNLKDEEYCFRKNGHGSIEFDDSTVNSYRITKVASIIYQAIMRIGRIHGSMNQKDVYIIGSNQMILDCITEQFPGASLKHDFNLQIESKSQQKGETHLKSYELDFIEFVKVNGAGKYKKSRITKAIGLMSNNFKMSVLRNSKIMRAVRSLGYEIQETNNRRITIERVSQ